MVVLLYDISGSAHRFFHTTGDSQDPNAISNEILDQVRKLRTQWPESRMVVCCDSRKSWRKELCSEYKAQREARPDWLYQQIDRAKRHLSADGCVVLEHEGMEADDIIASCTKSLKDHQEVEHIVVVTIDKDLEQLVWDGDGDTTPVSIHNPVLDSTIAREHVIAKFGVAPEQVGDWLALVGDESDNVTGARGIGKKRATDLLLKFGSLAGISRAVEVCSGPEQWAALFKGDAAAKNIGGQAVFRSLKENGAQVKLARQLVALRDDVPVDVERILREPMPTGLKTEEQAPLEDPDFLVDPEEEPTEVAEEYDSSLSARAAGVVDPAQDLRERVEQSMVLAASAPSEEPRPAATPPVKTLKTEPEPKPEPQQPKQQHGGRSMGFTFTKATKKQSRLRMALVGPAGSGKTWSSLKLSEAILRLLNLHTRIALIDSERGSAAKYSDVFDFDHCRLESFSPETYIDAIQSAEQAGYGALVIDSLSHAWSGKDGALEQVDLATMRSRSKNQFTDGWRAVTPMHNRLVDTMLSCSMHLIVTMRTKTEYVVEKNDRGQSIPRKVGLQPVQRAGLEYEFDVVADMDQDNNCIIDKTRCSKLKGKVFNCPGDEMAKILASWITDGAPAEQEQQVVKAVAASSAFDELASTMVWVDKAGKDAWVFAVKSAMNSGAITKAQASDLSARCQARSQSVGITTTNGAANDARQGAA